MSGADQLAGGAALAEADVQKLGAALGGAMILPGDDAYEVTRRVWNGMIDKRPALIAQCAGVADVITAVQFARDHDLLVAVRGGGHNVAGNAVCDGGMMIDLSRLKSVRVDPSARTARAEPGAYMGGVRSRNSGVWTGHHWGAGFRDGHRRVYPWWRRRVVGEEVRTDV